MAAGAALAGDRSSPEPYGTPSGTPMMAISAARSRRSSWRGKPEKVDVPSGTGTVRAVISLFPFCLLVCRDVVANAASRLHRVLSPLSGCYQLGYEPMEGLLIKL